MACILGCITPCFNKIKDVTKLPPINLAFKEGESQFYLKNILHSDPFQKPKVIISWFPYNMVGFCVATAIAATVNTIMSQAMYCETCHPTDTNMFFAFPNNLAADFIITTLVQTVITFVMSSGLAYRDGAIQFPLRISKVHELKPWFVGTKLDWFKFPQAYPVFGPFWKCRDEHFDDIAGADANGASNGVANGASNGKTTDIENNNAGASADVEYHSPDEEDNKEGEHNAAPPAGGRKKMAILREHRDALEKAWNTTGVSRIGRASLQESSSVAQTISKKADGKSKIRRPPQAFAGDELEYVDYTMPFGQRLRKHVLSGAKYGILQMQVICTLPMILVSYLVIEVGRGQTNWSTQDIVYVKAIGYGIMQAWLQYFVTREVLILSHWTCGIEPHLKK